MLCTKCKQEVPIGKFCDLCGCEMISRETTMGVANGSHTNNNYIPGKYEILREIGRGGMGVVYEAMNKEIHKKVALKKMRDELAINPRDKERFLAEARHVAVLHHQNILDIYDMFEQERNVYIVFEYVDGETVETILNRKIKLTLEETIKIALSVCEALHFAHNHKVVHRDLKPSNIMVTASGWVKVMDFGIAREIKDTISRITGHDTTGAPPYMSPEQHLGSYDPRSDIYSLGVTVYEMLTGDLPFKGPDFLVQKERMVYKHIKELVPELPESVDQIINKCLQANKEERYKTVEELCKDLKTITV